MTPTNQRMRKARSETQPLPSVVAAAERRNVVEVGVSFLDRQEFVAVVESLFVARAIDQPVFLVLMAVGLIKEPMHHAAKRRNAGARGDEDRILMRLAQGEHPMRAMKLDDGALFQIAKPV